MSQRVVSHGGGVQSTALLVLAAEGRIDFKTFLFANVGDDSEHPATLRYLDEYAAPFAAEHGLVLERLRYTMRNGTQPTLMDVLTKAGSRSVPIPVRMRDTGAPGTRNCTMRFKIDVIDRWLKERGASIDNPATVAIGFSEDEAGRASTFQPRLYKKNVYPLLDLRLRRSDCMGIIQDAGLPIPQKSACYFCPFHRPSTWREMRRDEPELFEKSAQLEDLLNKRRTMLGKDHVYLTRFGGPIREVIGEAQASLFDEEDGPDTCGYGSCFT